MTAELRYFVPTTDGELRQRRIRVVAKDARQAKTRARQTLKRSEAPEPFTIGKPELDEPEAA